MCVGIVSTPIMASSSVLKLTSFLAIYVRADA